MSTHTPQPSRPLPPLTDALASERDSVRFEPLNVLWLDTLLPVEQQAYSHPWTRGNFIDAMAAGYETQLLVDAQGGLVGYFVAMIVLDEVHLLNITVAPARQRQGWARILLDALALWSRQRQAQWIWLEVRESNVRARSIYAAHGYQEVGLRKNYYPMHDGPREHAVLMSLKLWP
ncbi:MULTISPECIES: ribosomal protein S18-alanine N-acetyltransferase [Delftia]|jgi:[ribosomal protein S18]-alanine N-acetyltransferase|uniref:[Ribosomal protein bS18]-alanine N-acetyltransferase n=2 Tax=Delftia TaxID=80865 RepID=A0AAX3SNJ3_9BURK|nr:MULTISPECIES: ribosomal protein S18-alanine N-acetyltransferase [Delftia]KAA9153398.1 ribosomal-protein-alanine N-acetyltransferase [Delftia sp. BR1]KEH14693.1 alanine acetyltransferase [Delftia sp. 670]AOV03433.1 ribosomal-protein-alanine N-acetyltransferase [Delftia tsuruhatensis]EPD36713.1 ribosomal-protein-alanine acetyltransferase [Delftia acidovorans CCUG 274B]EPD44239.1 ribosomal-protein-alanine acetyltransferase [Delftia acidovorans CCUG 15835]